MIKISLDRRGLQLPAIFKYSSCLSPLNYDHVETTRLTGKVLGWKWIRYCTPLINIYAFIFLFGGVVYSAFKLSKDAHYQRRFQGNPLIALGGLLRVGAHSPSLITPKSCIAKLPGIIPMYCGYAIIRLDTTKSMCQKKQSH